MPYGGIDLIAVESPDRPEIAGIVVPKHSLVVPAVVMEKIDLGIGSNGQVQHMLVVNVRAFRAPVRWSRGAFAKRAPFMLGWGTRK